MNKIALTKSKTKWYSERPNKHIIKGKPLKPNIATQKRYEARINRLVEIMVKETNREIIKLFKKDKVLGTMDSDIASASRILMNFLTNKFVNLFKSDGLSISTQMTNNTEKNVSSSLFNSFKEISGGLNIKTSNISKRTKSILKASTNESAYLIKSIAQKYLDDVAGGVYRSIAEGNGLADLVPQLEKYEGITKRRAKNIALDQTRKAFNNVSNQKMVDAGVYKFIWKHSAGSFNPRDFHQARDGKIYDLRNPPMHKGRPDLPSNLSYCRCYSIPVLEFED